MIAFTHLRDKIPSDCTSQSSAWCMANMVTYVVIPETVVKTSHIATYIVNQLNAFGIISSTAQSAITILRTTMRSMTASHKMFTPRCVFE